MYSSGQLNRGAMAAPVDHARLTLPSQPNHQHGEMHPQTICYLPWLHGGCPGDLTYAFPRQSHQLLPSTQLQAGCTKGSPDD